MKKGMWFIAVVVLVVLVLGGGYMVINGQKQAQGDKQVQRNQTISSSQATYPALSLENLQKGDVTSLTGSWLTEDGQVLSNQDRQNWIEKKISQFSLQDGYLVNVGRRAGDKGVLLIPAGVAGPQLSSPALSTHFETLASVDRLVMAGIEPVVYYREQDVDKVRKSNQSIQLLTALTQLIQQYREDSNQTLADQADHLVRDFTEDSASYPEIRSTLLEQAQAGVISYDSYTLELTDIQRLGNHVQFRLTSSVTTHYGDGRPATDATQTQLYKAKEVQGKWYLDSIETEK